MITMIIIMMHALHAFPFAPTRPSPVAMRGTRGEFVVVVIEAIEARRATLRELRSAEQVAAFLDLASDDDGNDAPRRTHHGALAREALALVCADAVSSEELDDALSTSHGQKRARLALLLARAQARDAAHDGWIVVAEDDGDDERFAARLRFLLRLVADRGARVTLLARPGANESFADRVVVDEETRSAHAHSPDLAASRGRR
jgi:hypothetical protein